MTPDSTPDAARGPVTPQIVSGTQKIILEQPATYFGRFGKLALIGLVVAIFFIVGQFAAYNSYFSPPGGPQEKYHSLDKLATKKVAILEISGTILKADGFIKKQIDRVRGDEDVIGVVLRIDSPGGTVTASDYLYHHLNSLRSERKIPIVVSMGGLCASGGYYLAMAVGDQEDSVFAEPSTWTGSIGVVIPHYDLSGLLEQFNVKDDSVASHPYKLMGSPTRHLSEEERATERELLQSLVDESFGRFKKVVRSGRPAFRDDPDALDSSATGQIFSAEQALQRGLVDKIGFIEDAVARVVELAGANASDVRCVKYETPPTVIDTLMGADADHLRRSAARSDLASLFDLAAPRAYYLWTATPGLLNGAR